MNNTMLSANEVMDRLGYRDRKNFWNLVRQERIPHVRLNARVIRFESGPLEEWIEKRRSVKSKTTPALQMRAIALGLDGRPL